MLGSGDTVEKGVFPAILEDHSDSEETASSLQVPDGHLS